MADKFIYQGRSLVFVQCCECNVEYAIPANLNDKALERRGQFGTHVYCPNGHYWFYIGETKAEKERRRAELAEQRIAQRDDEIRDLERAVSAQKGNVTKLKRRAAAGTCPCCQRTFMNVNAHLANKHPEFIAGQRTCREKLALVK